MIEIVTKSLIFKKKHIWFSDYPFDVKGVDAVFFYACKTKSDYDGFVCTEAPTIIIDLNQDLDRIWKNMEQKSCRYFINRARREGIEVRKNSGEDEFIQLFLRFVKEKKFEYSREAVEIMKKRLGVFFTSYLNGELLSGMMTVEDRARSRWLIGASKRLEVEREKAILVGCANRFMVWEAIRDARDRNLKEFDLGGYWGGEDKNDPRYTIDSFKRSFGGQVVTYYKYKKFYSITYKLAKYVLQSIKKQKVS